MVTHATVCSKAYVLQLHSFVNYNKRLRNIGVKLEVHRRCVKSITSKIPSVKYNSTLL